MSSSSPNWSLSSSTASRNGREDSGMGLALVGLAMGSPIFCILCVVGMRRIGFGERVRNFVFGREGILQNQDPNIGNDQAVDLAEPEPNLVEYAPEPFSLSALNTVRLWMRDPFRRHTEVLEIPLLSAPDDPFRYSAIIIEEGHDNVPPPSYRAAVENED